jgi:hypothetical protein
MSHALASNLVAIAESPLCSDSAGPGPVLLRTRSAWRLRRPCRCRSGPLLRPAIRRNLTVASDRQLTTSRGPRKEPLRNSTTPTHGSGWKTQPGVRNSKLKTKNSKLFRELMGTSRLRQLAQLNISLCPLCASVVLRVRGRKIRNPKFPA